MNHLLVILYCFPEELPLSCYLYKCLGQNRIALLWCGLDTGTGPFLQPNSTSFSEVSGICFFCFSESGGHGLYPNSSCNLRSVAPSCFVCPCVVSPRCMKWSGYGVRSEDWGYLVTLPRHQCFRSPCQWCFRCLKG